MARERKKTRKAANRRKPSLAEKAVKAIRSVLGGRRSATAPLGMNKYCVMVDEVNFVTPEQAETNMEHERRMANKAIKDNKPAMLVLAESAMTRREIEKCLFAQATDYVEHRPHTSQAEVVDYLHGLCDQRYWSNFQRRRTVEQIAARVCSRNGVYRLRRLKQRIDASMAASMYRG